LKNTWSQVQFCRYVANKVDLVNVCVAVSWLRLAKTYQSRKESILNCLLMKGQGFIYKNVGQNFLANLKRVKNVGAKANNM